ncbi:MAG: AgmX/PglI C-terminal domain-containing protein [Myxococcota bacterium]
MTPSLASFVLLGVLGCADETAPPDAPVPEPPAAVPAVDVAEAPRTDADLVQEAVRSYQGSLRACYNALLRRDPDAGGRIEVSWELLDGRAQNLAILSDGIGDPTMATCLTTKIEAWEFPDTVSGDVTWPFVFRPAAATP